MNPLVNSFRPIVHMNNRDLSFHSLNVSRKDYLLSRFRNVP